MKPRLFWTTLAAFVLVIGLGICGMLGFVSLALAGAWEPNDTRSAADVRPPMAAFFADYYLAHHNSWDGLDQRLKALEGNPFSPFSVVVADANGRVVASINQLLPVGQTADAQVVTRGTPILVGNVSVGTLLTRASFGRAFSRDESGPPAFFWPVARAFLGAGLVLACLLSGLAVLFARWLSTPLRRLMSAAHALSDGQLDVRVQGARVRELDDLAQSFNTMAAALNDADRQRRQMTADIAHELRTPLTIIKGRLEGVQDGVYQATPEQIGVLLGEVSLLERLINDLRLLALAEAGELPLYSETLDLHDLLDDAAAAFADQARAQDIALHVSAPDDLPPIFADPQRLAQVLANLVANALRYTPAGGTVTLCANAEPSVLVPQSSVLFEVSDTGTGIAPDDLPHVFDRFWRANRARVRGSGGAGLGLAIAKQIIAAHGGTITAHHNVPQGTTMRIVLPAAKDEG